MQTVVRPQSEEFQDFRGYACRIAGGIWKKGDRIVHLPSGFATKVASIVDMNGEIEEAFAPMSVTITLEDDIDISRGDMIVRENNMPEEGQDIELMVCWMSETPLQLNGKYGMIHTTRETRCVIKDVRYKVDINSLHKLENEKVLGLNDIGRITVRTTNRLFYDNYRRNRTTGSVIIIDEATNSTVGAGMII